MKIAPLVLAASVCLAAPALADGKVYVQLPDMSYFGGEIGEDFLYQLVLANVVSSNCPGFEVTDAEWSLLTDSADLLAYGELKLGTNDFDNLFYDPAFAALDEPTTCAEEGPAVEEILTELVEHGGSREPLPDQEKAYAEWRVLMDNLHAQAEAPEAEAAPKGKIKHK